MQHQSQRKGKKFLDLNTNDTLISTSNFYINLNLKVLNQSQLKN